jgi:hypothetical protein
VDESRIQKLRDEVLSQVAGTPRAPGDLETRVAALEAAVAGLQQRSAPAGTPVLHLHTHPALQVLGPGSGGERCLMEPDKPCVQSHACRTFGH